MPAPREVHRHATRVMSAAMVVIGIAALVVTFANGGGPLARGALMGILFVLAGAGRLYLARGGR
ncbi:MAG: hypothetical protein QOI62_3156 [Solirubrobacteraceae bacterium]|jgi:hypothetical protein|nr:hypothetical protein [Solirubrobacteraceae bacterium]